tara:strand:+ start:1050 stop:1646 length:597 start_codon:yes stop_codon:yes gene_type:complete
MFLIKLLYFFWNFIPSFAKWWYGLTMKVTKNDRFPVQKVSTYSQIGERLKWGQRYREDKWGGKLDNLSHPTEIERRASLGYLIGDCDDHAIYWATSLLKSDLVLKVFFSFYQKRSRDTGKLSGHVVCVFVDKENRMKWCDYRMPSDIEERWQWAEQSAERYNADVLTAAMIEVVGIKPDDTPIFGEIDRKVWHQEEGT